MSSTPANPIVASEEETDTAIECVARQTVQKLIDLTLGGDDEDDVATRPATTPEDVPTTSQQPSPSEQTLSTVAATSDTTTTTTTSTTTTSSSKEENSNLTDEQKKLRKEHKIKWVSPTFGAKYPIVLQDENGVCPLISICNVLFIRNEITIRAEAGEISGERLIALVTGRLFELQARQTEGSTGALTFEQNIGEVLDCNILYKLLSGIDINMKFDHVTGMEATNQLLPFDLLNIGLLHTWVVDRDAQPLIHAVFRDRSYNTLIEARINAFDTNMTSTDNEKTDALLIQDFMDTHSSQMTLYGLQQLIDYLRDDDICVVFRNNHFLTVTKHEGKVYSLITDEGYLYCPANIWEHLLSVAGTDNVLVDGNFEEQKPLQLEEVTPNTDLDEQLALALANSLSTAEAEDLRRSGGGEPTATISAEQQEEHDRALAMQLQRQEEEEEIASSHSRLEAGSSAASTPSYAPHVAPPQQSHKSKCSIS